MKKLILLFLICLISISYAQENPVYFKAYYPEFIPVNTNFDISIVSRIQYTNADRVIFYILTDDATNLESVLFKNLKINKQVKHQIVTYKKRSEKCYSFYFDLKDTTYDLSRTFQLLLNLSSRTLDNGNISFAIEIEEENDSIVSSISSFDKNGSSLPTIKLNYYTPQSIAGSLLQVEKNGFLKLNFNNKENINNLLLSFWCNPPIFSRSFFNITNSQTNETIINLSSNEFQTITSNEPEGYKLNANQIISKNTWIHFSLFFNTSNKKIEVYANDKILFTIPLELNLNLSNLEFEFVNNEDEKLQIDLLKIWKFENSLEQIFLNKHYNSFQADSSKLLFDLNFDSEISFNNNSNGKTFILKAERTKISKSDAPIFSKAPELNVNIYENYYQLEWKVLDLNSAVRIMVEKSTDGKSYKEIGQVFVSKNKEEIYNFVDAKTLEDNIIYYRICQINNDGSKTYSAQMKIGQGEKKKFILRQNYPNPFNPITTIYVEIIESTEIELSIYNLSGKKISTLHKGTLGAGNHGFKFDGSNLPSGIYLYEIKSPTASVVQKMILAK
ncbi:MAG: T9SS type A sorting domain-containing protein [Ignavibacteriales bacterium]|nr:T9SS type A sorting domain-containing protein [Ignavibacteriales bacterium]